MGDLFRGLRPVHIEMEERCDEHGGVIAPGTTVNKEDLIAFITAVVQSNPKEKVMSTTEKAVCSVCGEPMPPGEEVFNYHGYSGPCPKPPLARPSTERDDATRIANQVLWGHADKPDIYLLCRELLRVTNASAPMRRALEEAQSTLELMEQMPPRDPAHHERVSALGREIGFGALMACAARGWEEEAAARGYPAGGHHVGGPSHNVVLATLRCVREALR